MSHLFLAAALVAYVVGIVLAILATVYRGTATRRGASWAWGVAWTLHTATCVSLAASSGRVPLTNQIEYLISLGWAVMTLHLWVWFRQRLWVAGLVLPPVAALAVFVAWGRTAAAAPALPPRPSSWFLLHTTVSTLGIAMLGLAFAMSVLYLVQDRALKARRSLGLLERLPALERCDHIGFHAMLVGFVLLTLGIGTGVVMNARLHERLWVPGAKQNFPLLAWIVFAVLLSARRAFGFRGRKSAYLVIAGFVLGLLTVFGMTL